MKNIEKYYDAIKHKLQTTDVPNLYCTVNEIRTGCDDCPEWRNCRECCLKNLEWLNQEYKEPILDDVEREYLSAVIKPFRKKVKYIAKLNGFGEARQFIRIIMCDCDCANLPFFKSGTMYKGMKLDKQYTIEELGL